MSRRGRLADEKLTLLRQLLKGEPVVSDGRRIHVTPACTITRWTVHHAGRRQRGRGQARGQARAGFVLQTNQPA